MAKKKRKSRGEPSAVGHKTSKKLKKFERSGEKSSLAQLLKKRRGVAADTQAPPVWKDKKGRAFLTPDDDQKAFDECLLTSFKGFHVDPPSSLPKSLHDTFDNCFEGLEREGLFLYDVVQPGKKKLTRTSVKRTLVGAAGSTYKYLGLRLFSHPWVDVDDDGNELHTDKAVKEGSSLKTLGYSSRATSTLIAMGIVNKDLTDRSMQKIRQHVSAEPAGSAEFNLTLVNKMESISTKRDLKQEVVYNMGKTSVGWHRDSGLKDFSTITVYQKQISQTSQLNSRKPFGVAIRAMEGGAGGPLASVPALMAPLSSGSLYYMLDDFNHNHEHAVIAGDDGVRYSSTHRVAREGQGTWQYIRDKIRNLQSSAEMFDWSKGKVNDSSLSPKKRKLKLVSCLRNQESLLSEIEFEWLRQWFVQGKKHAQLHPYWHNPIKILIQSFCELEQKSMQLIKLLQESSKHGASKSEDLCEALFDVLIESYTERKKKRQEWARRYKDPIFRDLPESERPFPCPCLDDDGEQQRSGESSFRDLESSIKIFRELRSLFVTSDNQGQGLDDAKVDKSKKNKKKKKKLKSSSLTSKEKKKVASNWNALKSKISG